MSVLILQSKDSIAASAPSKETEERGCLVKLPLRSGDQGFSLCIDRIPDRLLNTGFLLDLRILDLDLQTLSVFRTGIVDLHIRINLNRRLSRRSCPASCRDRRVTFRSDLQIAKAKLRFFPDNIACICRSDRAPGERVFMEIALILRDRKVQGHLIDPCRKCFRLGFQTGRIHKLRGICLRACEDILLHRPAHELLRLSVYGTILVKLRCHKSDGCRICLARTDRRISAVPERDLRCQACALHEIVGVKFQGSFPNLLGSDSVGNRVITGIRCHAAVSCRRDDLRYLFTFTVLIRFRLSKFRQCTLCHDKKSCLFRIL